MKSQEETMEILSKLETRTRQMLFRHQEVMNEMQNLRTQLEERDEQIRQLIEAAKEDKQAYERLKMAKYLDAMDDDAHSTRARINRMIASVDKCIAILKNND
jgi:DNA repair exonuclease SbcCD ATPase subunit